MPLALGETSSSVTAAALAHFSPNVDDRLPIRQLFKPTIEYLAEPTLHLVDPSVEGASCCWASCCPAHVGTYQPGDRVYAKAGGEAPETYSGFKRFEERWYLAVVDSVNKDGKYKVTRSQGSTKDVIKAPENVAPAGLRHDNISGITTYAAMVLFCAFLTVVTADSGTIAFGSLAATRLLFCFNVVAGENSGDQELETRNFFAIAEELRQKVHADISADELRWSLARFLDLPASAESVELSLPLLTVMRSGIWGIEPDSTRVRYCILLASHLEMVEGPHGGNPPPHSKTRRDLIVDVFKGACMVPGVELTREKWHMEGSKYPWHLAIKANFAANSLEPAVREDGHAEGFFSYSPDGPGSWLSNEAPDVKAISQRTANHSDKTEGLIQDLHSVVCAVTELDEAKKVRAMKALVDAGADVNYAPQTLSGYTPLHAALADSLPEVAKLLIASKADIEALYLLPNTAPWSPFSGAFEADWEAATMFYAHSIFEADRELKQRLGLEAPEHSASFSPGDPVEVTSGGGAGQFGIILDAPYPGVVFRINGKYPVKRTSEMQAVSDDVDLEGVCITHWEWPVGKKASLDPRGIFMRSREFDTKFPDREIHVNRLGGMVLYRRSSGRWAMILERQLHRPADAESHIMQDLRYDYGNEPDNGMEWASGIKFATLAKKGLGDVEEKKPSESKSSLWKRKV